jgi:LuxR family transcriptional regulator
MGIAWNGLSIVNRFSSGLERAQGLEESLDVLHEAVTELGWSRVAYGWAGGARTGDTANVPLKFRGFPDRWNRQIRHWSRHSAHDPYYQVATVSQSAVRWRDVRANLSTLTQAQRDCISYADDLGMVDGLTVPINVAGRRFAFVTALDFVPDDSVPSDDQAASLLTLMAHFFDNRVLDAARETDRQPRTISRREQQCLFWSARGKTVEEIGDILDLSAQTIRVFLKRVNQKLQACNRTQAVAKAMQMGIIELN